MLPKAIENARKRLQLNHKEYAKRVGLTVQALLKIKRGGGITGETLAKLQERGGIRITRRLIASLNPPDESSHRAAPKRRKAA